jgi:hypothetical protein
MNVNDIPILDGYIIISLHMPPKKLWLVISYKIPFITFHHQLHFGTAAPGTTRPAVATSPPPTHRILRQLRRCGAASATTWRSSDFCDVYGMQIAAMKQYLALM